MAIYITGDTHGGFQRFGSKYFPQQKNMGREDYVIITGDFGGCGMGVIKTGIGWTGWRTSPLRLPFWTETMRTSTC